MDITALQARIDKLEQELQELKQDSKSAPIDDRKEFIAPHEALVFAVEESLFAVDVRFVQEVVQMVFIDATIGTAKQVCGVVEYRGQVIPVVDINVILKGKTRKLTAAMSLAIVSHNNKMFAIVLDSIHGVLRFSPDAQHKAQQLENLPRCISGLLTHQGRLVSVLQHESLLSKHDIDQAKAAFEQIKTQESQKEHTNE